MTNMHSGARLREHCARLRGHAQQQRQLGHAGARQQQDIRGRGGCVARRVRDRDAHVGRRKRRCVVDAVADLPHSSPTLM